MRNMAMDCAVLGGGRSVQWRKTGEQAEVSGAE